MLHSRNRCLANVNPLIMFGNICKFDKFLLKVANNCKIEKILTKFVKITNVSFEFS